jgi:hypothetical protein
MDERAAYAVLYFRQVYEGRQMYILRDDAVIEVEIIAGRAAAAGGEYEHERQNGGKAAKGCEAFFSVDLVHVEPPSQTGVV